jgi:hypothetical protein
MTHLRKIMLEELERRNYNPGLGAELPELSPPNSSLRRSVDKLDQEVTSWIQHAKLAA